MPALVILLASAAAIKAFLSISANGYEHPISPMIPDLILDPSIPILISSIKRLINWLMLKDCIPFVK